MKTIRAGFMAGVVLCVVGLETAGAELRVWTDVTTRRVLRDEAAGTETGVKISAAKNEWEGFQILLRSDAAVKGITVEAGDLKGPGGAVLPGGDARLYRQHQMEIAKGTYRNEAFKPGWYPDPLILLRHPVTGEPLGEARFRAVPFDLPAGQTHGFWVDIYVPAKARAGEYKGTYRVRAEGGKAVDIPMTLAVWDFALPRVSTLQTALGSPAGRMRSYYRERAKEGKEKEPSDWEAVEKQCAEMLTQHRINATPWHGLGPEAQADGSFRIPDEQVRELREFVDRYHVNAISVRSPVGIVNDPEKESDKLYAWLKAWDVAAAKLVYNGEGTIVYPGRDVGYDGIAPSLRLKALRDSVEDYEYMAILERKGLGDEARKIVEALAESWFEWEADPGEYERARARLAEMILEDGEKVSR